MVSSGADTPSMTKTASELWSKQGINGFYRGIDSNIARAMVLNGTKMGVYDQSKGYVVALTGLSPKSLGTQFLSAVTAGFFMTCTVAPFDMVRTRLMNQPADARIYNNAVDCMLKIAKNEGPLTFWRGFMRSSFWASRNMAGESPWHPKTAGRRLPPTRQPDCRRP